MCSIHSIHRSSGSSADKVVCGGRHACQCAYIACTAYTAWTATQHAQHTYTGVKPIKKVHVDAGILNRVRWMQAAYPLHHDDVVAFKTSPCFVDHLWELFGPLLSGMQLNACCIHVCQHARHGIQDMSTYGSDDNAMEKCCARACQGRSM